MKKEYTRREFLKGTASSALAGALYLGTSKQSHAKSETKSRVILIRHKDVLDELNRPKPAVVEDMMDQAVTLLLDEKEPISAWKRLIKPTDVVGIKSNEWSFIPTPAALENVIKQRVLDTGVAEKNIGIRDRGVLRDPLFRKATALINVRPMRTHHWSGVGSLIKNYIMFVKSPSSYHPDACADLATIWNLPLVQGKTRLNILVLFTPLFHGIGPHHFSPKYIWAYKGMLVGFDPVAIDSIGVRILQAKRREFFGEERPLTPSAKHISLADTRHHLGTADPKKIELITIGLEEGRLI
jgi:hypothetical protein